MQLKIVVQTITKLITRETLTDLKTDMRLALAEVDIELEKSEIKAIVFINGAKVGSSSLPL
jgi:hypothetical protein